MSPSHSRERRRPKEGMGLARHRVDAIARSSSKTNEIPSLAVAVTAHRRNHAFWLFLALPSSHLDHIISPRGPGRIHDQIPFLRSCPLLSSPVSPSPSRCRCSSGVVRGDQSRRLCHSDPSSLLYLDHHDISSRGDFQTTRLWSASCPTSKYKPFNCDGDSTSRY